MITVTRYHDFSAAHRAPMDPGKCNRIHGHNYRIHFTFASHYGVGADGRVISFGEIKDLFVNWLEENWDHRLLVWDQDPICESLNNIMRGDYGTEAVFDLLTDSIRSVPFDTSVENMAEYLRVQLGPALLQSHPHVELINVLVEETRKCSAASSLSSMSLYDDAQSPDQTEFDLPL